MCHQHCSGDSLWGSQEDASNIHSFLLLKSLKYYLWRTPVSVGTVWSNRDFHVFFSDIFKDDAFISTTNLYSYQKIFHNQHVFNFYVCHQKQINNTKKNPTPQKTYKTTRKKQTNKQKEIQNSQIVFPDNDPILSSKSIRKLTTVLLHGILGRIRLKCLKDSTSLQSWGKPSWLCSSWFAKCILFPKEM